MHALVEACVVILLTSPLIFQSDRLVLHERCATDAPFSGSEFFSSETASSSTSAIAERSQASSHRSLIMLHEGDSAPDFSLPDQEGNVHSLDEYRGKKLVLYFYPKDLTPGCTAEACDFRDNLARATSVGAAVVGISPDSVKQHGKFAAKESLNFPLLADEGALVAQRYGVWKEKSMYGRTYMGIERTTFVIDEKGKISKIFPKVRVKGHVEEVLRALAD